MIRLSLARAAVVLAAVTIIIVRASRCAAQDEFWDWQMTPTITAEELDAFLASQPGLSDDQRALARAMHQNFVQELFDAAGEYRAYWERAAARREAEAEAMQDRWRFRDMQQTRAEQESNTTVHPQVTWNVERPRVERQFFDDLATVFEGEARQAWRSLERGERRRRYTAGNSIIPREPIIDLVALVDSLGLPEEERNHISPIIGQYEIDFDDQMQYAETVLAELAVERETLSNKDPQNNDPRIQQRAREILDRFDSFRRTMSRLTFGYFDQIVADLPDPYQAAFKEAFGRAVIPSAFHPSPAQLAIEHLVEADGVSAERKDAMSNMLDAFRQRERIILDAIVANHRKQALAPPPSQRQQEEWQERRQWALEQERIDPEFYHIELLPDTKPWRDRHNLVMATCRDIRRLFNDVEFAALPVHIRLLLSWE